MASNKKTSKPELRQLVWNKFSGKCAYCGCDLDFSKFHIDHFIAKRRGDRNGNHGPETVENYMPSCIPCNLSKSDFPLEFWRSELSKKLDRIKRDSSTFRLLLKYGLIIENQNPILFHFESHG